MEKIMGRKKLIAVLAAVAIVVLGVLVYIMAFGNRNQSYRSIKIVEMEGTVIIERAGKESLNASVNMNLVSGDYVTTAQDSYVVLRLDSDKYVMLGENGAMTVNAEGDEQNGRTSIELAAGSVLNEIQNPLSQDSTFDIVMPNATMSVRGTVFEVRKNSDGTCGVLVYGGHVAVGLDGMEPVMYDAGEYAEFTEGDAPKFLTEKGTITEAQIDEKVLERLQQIQEQGRDLNLDAIQKTSDANVTEPEQTKPQTSAEAEALAKEKEAAAQKEAEQKEIAAQKEVEQKAAEQKTAEAQKKELAQAQTQKPAQSKPQVQPQAPAQNETVTQPQTPEQNQEPAAEVDADDDDDDDDSDTQPDEPNPDQPIIPEPGQPDTPNPDQPVTPEPDKPVTPGPDQPDNPNPDHPVTPKPDKPNPEKPDKPNPDKPEQCTVTYKLPYIVVSVVDGGVVCSDMKDIVPVDYATQSGDEIRYIDNVTVDKTAGYEGSIGGATNYNLIGWCTEDGTQWEFNDNNNAIQQDIALYPIWNSNGKTYYPVIYTDPDTEITYCNSIEKGSVPRVNGAIISQ